MKPFVVAAGWVLFGFELLATAILFLQRDVGDDAAGRGMATGFAIVLTPVVLGAGALMWWGQRGGPVAASVTGLLIVSLPLLYGIVNLVTGTFGRIEQARGLAQYGKFDDPTLTELARAIDRGDRQRVDQLLATGTIDFTARDHRGRTILGHAVTRAIDFEGTAAQVEAVRQLVQAGAKPFENIIAPAPTSAEPEGHLLLISVVGSQGEKARAVLDILLDAGLSPNGVDMDGRPVIFSTYIDREELEVLAQHGTDFHVKDNRSDRPGWSALMNAAYMSDWEAAQFFLRHGVDPAYQAPDGTTLAAILAEKSDDAAAQQLRELVAVEVRRP